MPSLRSGRGSIFHFLHQARLREEIIENAKRKIAEAQRAHEEAVQEALQVNLSNRQGKEGERLEPSPA